MYGIQLRLQRLGHPVLTRWNRVRGHLVDGLGRTERWQGRTAWNEELFETVLYHKHAVHSTLPVYLSHQLSLPFLEKWRNGESIAFAHVLFNSWKVPFFREYALANFMRQRF